MIDVVFKAIIDLWKDFFVRREQVEITHIGQITTLLNELRWNKSLLESRTNIRGVPLRMEAWMAANSSGTIPASDGFEIVNDFYSDATIYNHQVQIALSDRSPGIQQVVAELYNRLRPKVDRAIGAVEEWLKTHKSRRLELWKVGVAAIFIMVGLGLVIWYKTQPHTRPGSFRTQEVRGAGGVNIADLNASGDVNINISQLEQQIANPSIQSDYKQFAKHLTQRQAVMLAEAYLLVAPDSPELLAYIKEHGALTFSGLANSPLNALLLSDHQHLVGLGFLEDGPISVRDHPVPWSSEKGLEMSYPSKITPLGKQVIRWRLKLDEFLPPLERSEQAAGQIGGNVYQPAGDVNYIVNAPVTGGSDSSDSAVRQASLKADVAISRHLEDFERDVKRLVKEHAEAIDHIAGEMNQRGILSSGLHLRRQYEQAALVRQAIADRWLVCKRGIEDALLGIGAVEIQDTDLKNRVQLAEQRKEQALAEVVSMTDERFKGGKTFTPELVEAIKKEVVGL